MGAKDGYNLTAQTEASQIASSSNGTGSVRKVKEFHFNSDETKELLIGIFFWIAVVSIVGSISR